MKKFLFALCTIVSISNLQARYVVIDNDTDGQQATLVQATVRFADGTAMTKKSSCR